MNFDKEYTSPVAIKNQVDVTSSGLVLTKADHGFPEDIPACKNPHEDEFREIFSKQRILPFRLFDPIQYIHGVNGFSCSGYCLYAGEDPYSIDPWISIQRREQGKDTPVHIFRITDRLKPGTHKLDEWTFSSKERSRGECRLPGRTDTYALNQYITSILRNRSFPSEMNDPFLVIAKAKRLI